MNIEIANRLVSLRKANHLSQEELAAKIGISRQAVSKWERAEACPDTDNLIHWQICIKFHWTNFLKQTNPLKQKTKKKIKKKIKKRKIKYPDLEK